MKTKTSNNKIIFRPVKALGQNFLSNESVLNEIVESCDITEKSSIIEIGGGYGSLTREILKRNPFDFSVFEKDNRLSKLLEEELKEQKNVKVFGEDFLKVNLGKFLKENINDYIIVGNLPYNIVSNLIFKLEEITKKIKNIVFLIQKEVGEKWYSDNKLNNKKYSSTTIYVRLLYDIQLIKKVPKNLFYPIPKVDGVVLKIIPKKIEIEEKEKLKGLFKFIKRCFAARRKTLENNIYWIEKKVLRDILSSIGIIPNSRPQNLTIENYKSLFEKIKEL